MARDPVRCNPCSGSGQITCYTCHGAGSLRCNVHTRNGTCSYCGERDSPSGRKVCSNCYGRRYNRCGTCSGRGYHWELPMENESAHRNTVLYCTYCASKIKYCLFQPSRTAQRYFLFWSHVRLLIVEVRDAKRKRRIMNRNKPPLILYR